MEEEKISGRQFGILTFAMMLAPLVHAVPIRIASAGRASWLLTLPAVIPLGGMLYFLFRVCNGCRRAADWQTYIC